ncbi:MAG: energy transducer TonB, partial [Saprospiraceae bacterium]
DAGAPIHVHVNYMPENTLKHNDPKEFHFSFTIEPEKEAKYPGGQAALMTYLKENAIDKIPANTFVNYDLAAIKFTISEEGKVFNAKIFGQEYPKSYDKKFDQFLLESIQNMPNWIPAEYADGSKAKQEYVLTVGNMENCIIHLLNIRPGGRSGKG